MGKARIYGTGLRILFGAIWIVFTTAPFLSAQTPHPRIGVFTPGLSLTAVHKGMEDGLNRLGYIEGKNVTFLVEDTKGITSDLPSRAATLMATKPDLLFAVTNIHAMATKQATSTIPVVFAWVGNPVNAGLVTTYPYSKSNLTGVTSITDSLSGKRLEVLLQIAPKAKRVLVIVSSKESVSLKLVPVS
jgi:putative tryptophan/tyrosine transport system substrate-binding protein